MTQKQEWQQRLDAHNMQDVVNCNKAMFAKCREYGLGHVESVAAIDRAMQIVYSSHTVDPTRANVAAELALFSLGLILEKKI